jgi:hypothetical protein
LKLEQTETRRAVSVLFTLPLQAAFLLFFCAATLSPIRNPFLRLQVKFRKTKLREERLKEKEIGFAQK